MSFQPLSLPWPSDRALILVHGIGDHQRSSYDRLLAALEAAIGPDEWKSFTVYPLLYDVFNDWVAAKLGAEAALTKLIEHLGTRFGGEKIGATAAEYAGDVIWPVLAVDARHAIRDAILAQFARVVLDGGAAGVSRRRQRISIVAHSLGCFHVYEALSAAANEPRYRLQPDSDAVQLKSVVMMASPVQLIRSVAKKLRAVVPERESLYCLRGDSLELPGEVNMADLFVPSTRRLASLTGTLDPVGGYLFRKQLEWAYMNIPEQTSVIDDQALLNVGTEEALRQLLQAALGNGDGPGLTVNNPHDWVGYVERNAASLQEWVLG